MHTERTPCEDKGRSRWCSRSSRNTKDWQQSTRNWKRSMEQTVSQNPQKEPAPLKPWFWTSSLHNYETIYFYCLSRSVCGTLLPQPWYTACLWLFILSFFFFFFKSQYHHHCFLSLRFNIIELNHRDFPGGAVVKNPPANAGDTGSSPGGGRSHMLWSN